MNLWLSENHSHVIFDVRQVLCEYINNSVCNGMAINYLEYSVTQDDRLVVKTNLNTNEDSLVYVFDTFDGLPEP